MINSYQKELYEDLMTLVESSEAFFFKDFVADGSVYRIFNYRLASYTDFCMPGALECRGIMFQVDEDGNAIHLAAMPMEKFFNLNENPYTMGLDLTTVEEVGLKADGSLISTYVHAPWFNSQPALHLRLKTKGSLESDQALAAMKWLDLPENAQFKQELLAATRSGYTVNMEWTAPDNRIVIGYEKPGLIVLNVRCNADGSYVDVRDVDADNFPAILNHWVEQLDVEDPVAFAAAIPDMQGIEGYVIRLEAGQRLKIKTMWYLALHHTKDSINSPRRLFEAVLEEATDDMRSLFYDDPVAIRMIEEMEAFVEEKYNHMVDTVERFYERNKDMERKDYAVLGQQELTRMYFGLAMMRYTGKDVDYKTFMKSKWKQFGLKDSEDEE